MTHRLTFVCAHILWEGTRRLKGTRTFDSGGPEVHAVLGKVDVSKNVSNLPEKPKAPLSSSTPAGCRLLCFLLSGLRKRGE